MGTASNTTYGRHIFSHLANIAPLQLYSAGLFFSPTQSIIRTLFGMEALVDIQVMTQILDCIYLPHFLLAISVRYSSLFERLMPTVHLS